MNRGSALAILGGTLVNKSADAGQKPGGKAEALTPQTLAFRAAGQKPAGVGDVEGPVCYLLMPANSIELLRSEWERAKTGAIDFVDSMPEDKLTFRPVPEVLNFAGQFIHVAEANYVFGSGAFGVDNPNTTSKSEENQELWMQPALREFVAASYDFMIEGVGGMAPEAVDEEVPFFKWKMPRHLILAKALEHHAHHRGQTAIYFRLQGLKPPSERLF